MQNYKNFITTGCSFTAGVIENTDNSTKLWEDSSFVWPHYVFTEMGPDNKNFFNFALTGNGNVASFKNLIYFLELNKNIKAENSLIGFNLTALTRQDTICKIKHPKSMQCLTGQHIDSELQIGWIQKGNDVQTIEYGTNELIIYNCLSIIEGISYLELNNYNYFFMLMNSEIYTHSPNWFQEFLNLKRKRWIKFNNMDMWEFVKTEKLTTNDGHPSRIGHKLLASYVTQYIQNNEKI